MSEFAGFDLDRATARAWSRFQSRLADRVADLQDDDIVLVEAEAAREDVEGSAPYVQFCAWGETLVRAEVSSNAYLADEHLLDEAGCARLVDLGWQPPTTERDDEDPGEGSANFYLDLERVQADRLAVMTTRALKDVFGVAHPAFLSTDDLADDVIDPEIPSVDPADPPLSEPTDEGRAVVPRDRDHLLALVDEALTPFFGHLPEHDEDDDIPVVSGSALVFVSVDPHAPTILLFSALVHAVSDRERAAFEVAVLNRDLRFVKVVLVDDRVMAYLHLPAMPFVPEHLRWMLALMSDTADQVDDDLAVRVGGRRTYEPDDRDDDSDDGAAHEVGEDGAAHEVGGRLTPEGPEDGIHPAMLTLLELDADTPGSLTPELAASVCAMDRGLVLELITWNSEQEAAWRKARDDASLRDDQAEAEVCDREGRHAEALVNLLRRALRLLVEQQLGRHLQQSTYRAAIRSSRRPPWPDAPDPLPGVDVAEEQPGLDGLWDQP